MRVQAWKSVVGWGEVRVGYTPRQLFKILTHRIAYTTTNQRNRGGGYGGQQQGGYGGQQQGGYGQDRGGGGGGGRW
jgi:hypothetical protein